MKYLYTLLLCLLLQVSYAQKKKTDDIQNNLGKIVLSVVPPDDQTLLTESQMAMLQARALALASQNGVGAIGGTALFKLVPRIDIYEEKVAEVMENITVLKTEVTFIIKQEGSNTVFASYTKQISGSGSSKQEALTNVLSQINASDPQAQAFITEGKKKILAFFNAHCGDIMAEVDRWVAAGDYERAMAVLLCVPAEATPCGEKTKKRALAVFKQMQLNKCQTQLLQARGLAASGQNLEALTDLALVDPAAGCYHDAMTIMSTIEAKISEQERRDWELKRDRLKHQDDMEKARLEFMGNVVNGVGNAIGGIGGILSFLAIL
jgi:hypothetical protein